MLVIMCESDMLMFCKDELYVWVLSMERCVLGMILMSIISSTFLCDRHAQAAIFRRLLEMFRMLIVTFIRNL